MSKVILAIGYHDQNAPRHWNIKRDLEQEGWEVRECHTTKKGFFRKFHDLRRQYLDHQEDASAVLVTFPGHFLMPPLWLLTRGKHPKLMFDAFISLSDTLVDDRKKVSWVNPYAWFLYILDCLSCYLADEIWIDTEAHRQFFIKRFHIPPSKIRAIYLKARTDIFFPREYPPERAPGTPLEILFYGTYIPLQGIEHVLRAAKILQDQKVNVHFTLIGSGQTYKPMRALAERLGLSNVAFHERVPFSELPERIKVADLCLGIFDTGDKAGRVIPHKVYDAVACGVPVLTADTPAIRERCTNGKEVILCRAGDPKDLAAKIQEFAAKLG
ncbi:MAG: glycosyltransferase [Patescibacteria group bacterium]